MSSGEQSRSWALAKPAFTEAQASALLESVFGLRVTKIRPLPSYDDQNFYVDASGAEETSDGPAQYVLKISNAEASKNPDLIEVQTQIITFLKAAGFPTASVCRSKTGSTTSTVDVDSGSSTSSYVVRLLTYLPGRPVAELPVSSQLLYDIGRLAARLDKTLEEFRHPKLSCLHREGFIWNLKNVPLLDQYVGALGQNHSRQTVKRVIQLFKQQVAGKLNHFRECINHGDFNDHNILVQSSQSASGDNVDQVSGILDFDDMSYGYYVFEVAITIMYMMIESKDPMHVGGHVLAGFESVIPLTAVERSALFLLVCARFCQSLVMAAYSCQLHPENREYLMITAKTGWKHLQQMFDLGQAVVEKIWFETARTYEPRISLHD
ncbi:hydroxylysine kinase [Ochotona curzoniae]|uniref:hydroxylysine kinase n=1 Tax=Ochotona curzoniae TaxID=130825 RepID=UPI001B34B754|nr:hydroxylysine kinase [Ochotona curzoniae]